MSLSLYSWTDIKSASMLCNFAKYIIIASRLTRKHIVHEEASILYNSASTVFWKNDDFNASAFKKIYRYSPIAYDHFLIWYLSKVHQITVVSSLPMGKECKGTTIMKYACCSNNVKNVTNNRSHYKYSG